MVDEEAPIAPAETGAEETRRVHPARAALVKEWLERVQSAKQHPKIKKAFERMERCMHIAAHGADKTWIKEDKEESERYTVPVLTRHVNQAVATLYARNPRAVAERRKRRMAKTWDGKPESLQAAMQALAAVGGDMQMLELQSPAAAQLLLEVQSIQQFTQMLEGLADTMEILHDYFFDEQEFGYKQQLKAAVRRAKVNGVAYIKLGFQRIMEHRPEEVGKIADVTSKIKAVEQRVKKTARGEFTENDPELEELYTNLRDLENSPSLVVREGPVFDFPKSREIIVDPKCRHLKTFAGARWIAHEYCKTEDEIEETWGVDVRARGKPAGDDDLRTGGTTGRERGEERDEDMIRVYEIYDRKLRQKLVVCEEYDDFLEGPATPDIYLERFFPVFPIVFNEVESEEELYPPSDVWHARHAQAEYNRSREGLREHRIANRPYYVTSRGMLEQEDKNRLSNHAAHEVVELNSVSVGEDVSKVLQRGPNVNIDPNQYEVNMVYTDIQRTVGVQEANLGGTSGATATESSIAETSRGVAADDNVDDLDDVLTEVARSTGQVMLAELSKETVEEIVGPGATWPDYETSREELAKELFLKTKAGSSGRPNAAAEIAKLERALPYLIQLPEVNSRPLARRYSDLLDLDLDEIIIEGMPSITAQNAVAGRPAQPSPADPQNDPAQQGARGEQNNQNPQTNEPGPQPAYPAPTVQN